MQSERVQVRRVINCWFERVRFPLAIQELVPPPARRSLQNDAEGIRLLSRPLQLSCFPSCLVRPFGREGSLPCLQEIEPGQDRVVRWLGRNQRYTQPRCAR